MENAKKIILETLKNKACLKQDVFAKTKDVFSIFKNEAEKLITDLKPEIDKTSNNVVVNFTDKGDYEFHIKFGGDILVFFMHTNVFDFDKEHGVWKTKYVEGDASRAYCGMINVYNFLADSFKYNRLNDVGYLVARFFVNKELHYFVEGKEELGTFFNDFTNQEVSEDKIKDIVEASIIYAMDLDLLTPSFENMMAVSVSQVNEVTNAMNIKTEKRLGFKFKAENKSFK